MTDLDDQGRPEPPADGDEAATILGFLDFQRATLEWKCRGLDAAGLNATVAESTLTLGSLLKHMAWVEEHWFSRYLHKREMGKPWDTAPWQDDRDWEFTSAAADTPDELRAQWQRGVDLARAGVAEALEHGGLDQPAKRSWPDGPAPSLRWIILHMVEEYARHNGHADLLREAVDGETGE